uniref:Uncharacterized protein n=1 Tax=Wuchereria bancrofti TaxID=6293 RepID=A0AAF5Q6C3_WUCBA
MSQDSIASIYRRPILSVKLTMSLKCLFAIFLASNAYPTLQKDGTANYNVKTESELHPIPLPALPESSSSSGPEASINTVIPNDFSTNYDMKTESERYSHDKNSNPSPLFPETSSSPEPETSTHMELPSDSEYRPILSLVFPETSSSPEPETSTRTPIPNYDTEIESNRHSHDKHFSVLPGFPTTSSSPSPETSTHLPVPNDSMKTKSERHSSPSSSPVLPVFPITSSSPVPQTSVFCVQICKFLQFLLKFITVMQSGSIDDYCRNSQISVDQRNF